MRNLVTFFAAAVMAALAVQSACAADAPLAIGYVTKSATNQGWVLINKGATDAAREAGVKLIVAGPSAAGVLTGQIEAIERVLGQGVKAVAVAPVDSVGILPIVQRGRAHGIPFIAVDTAIEGNYCDSYVGTDNLAAAGAQADWVAGQIGDTDQIVLVNGDLAQSTGHDRRQGFLDRLKQLKPGVTVVEVQTAFDAEKARVGVLAALRAHPKTVVVANAWDDGTLGTVAALRSLGYGKGRVRVIGFDGAPNALALLRTGWIQADVAQMLYREGYEGVKVAIAAAKGETVPDRVDTGHQLVTPANLDRFIVDNKLGPSME
jgi:ribose transport system substrate-binding protein